MRRRCRWQFFESKIRTHADLWFLWHITLTPNGLNWISNKFRFKYFSPSLKAFFFVSTSSPEIALKHVQIYFIWHIISITSYRKLCLLEIEVYKKKKKTYWTKWIYSWLKWMLCWFVKHTNIKNNIIKLSVQRLESYQSHRLNYRLRMWQMFSWLKHFN